MNLKNRKTQLLVAIVLIIFVFVLALILVNRGTPVSKVNDAGGPPVSGLVDTDNALLNVTTQSDFIAIQNRTMDYLAKQGAQTSVKVVVSDVEPPVRDGSILKFNISIPELNQKNIAVEVDYAGDPEPTFSIPSKQFKMPLLGEEN